MLVREKLAPALAAALRAMPSAGSDTSSPLPPILLDVPPLPEMGDFTTGIALAVARQTHRTAVTVAQEIRSHFQAPPGLVERVDVAPSGFLSFHLRSSWQEEALREALRQRSDYGRNPELGSGSKVLVEYVSANPTGPLTAVHGRGAAVGDALSRLLSWTGHQVCREFYINDAGGQMERFGRALEARVLAEMSRTDGAGGGLASRHVADVAAAVVGASAAELGSLAPEARRAFLLEHGREAAIAIHRQTLDRLGVHFDEWRSERTLHAGGRLHTVVQSLVERGHTYEADGALWLRATAFGDSEDRPLLRGNGEATYLAADLAYHHEKFERGFDRLIDIWGPEHEAYVPRTAAGMAALGGDPATLEIIILGDVALRIDGMAVDGSTQKGSPLLLQEIIERVGPAAARFHFLSSPAAGPLVIDIDAAPPGDSPAALHSLIAAATRAGAPSAAADPANADLSALTGAPERTLLGLVAGLPDEITAAARERDPHRLLLFAQRTAAALDGLPDRPNSPAHAALAEAGGVVLNNVLTVLGLPAR